MQAFHSLFHAKPSTSTLSAELNAQIITVRPDLGAGRLEGNSLKGSAGRASSAALLQQWGSIG